MLSQIPIDNKLLGSLQETNNPLAYWVGYSEPLLVSAVHIRRWGIKLNNQLHLPRRWLDINGREMQDIWEAACRAVIGIVMTRPGIPEVGYQSINPLFIGVKE